MKLPEGLDYARIVEDCGEEWQEDLETCEPLGELIARRSMISALQAALGQPPSRVTLWIKGLSR